MDSKRLAQVGVCGGQFSFALPQLVDGLLVLTDDCQLFTNLEVDLCRLHLPGFHRPDVFFLCFIALLVFKLCL